MVNSNNKKIKIASLLTPITYGGVEKSNLLFLNNVDRGYYDIYPIIIIRPWENETPFERELIKMKYDYSRVHVSSNPKIDIFRYIKLYYHIKMIIKSQSIQLLHTHGYLADIFGLFVAKSLGIPIVSTCHGFIFNNIKLKLYFKIDLSSLKQFDRIIAVSKNIKQTLLESGINSSKIVLIQNAVQNIVVNDTELINADQDNNLITRENNELLLGYIGRFSEEKGIKYLVEAVATLIKRKISVKLILLGTGPEIVKIQNLVIKQKITENVVFIGFKDDIFSYLKMFDIFVLPSLTEGTPLVILEAMSAKVPVVATRVGGVPDIIQNGITGLLVNPCSGIELADAVIKLRNDNELKMTIVNNASALVKSKYDINSWVAKIYDVYHELLS